MKPLDERVAEHVEQILHPYVRVERSDGEQTDLFKHVDGKLYTGPAGTGKEASVWAGGSTLFIEVPYALQPYR